MFSLPLPRRKRRIDPEPELTPEVKALIALEGENESKGDANSPFSLSDSVKQRIVESYLEILAIPSPSGREDRLRGRLIQRLAEWGTEEIKTDPTGNLFAHLRPINPLRPRIAFTAHLDNFLRKEEPMSPTMQGTRIVNRHSSILGGDDKVAVAGFLELFRLIQEIAPEHGGVTLIFTVREESVLPNGWSYGAKSIDPRELENLSLIFAMDVPSGKSIQEDHFAVYHCHDADPILKAVRNSWNGLGAGHASPGQKEPVEGRGQQPRPYLESEARGFIGGDATTFYRKFGKKVIDFGTGNFNEHTRREYTELSLYLRQMEWIYSSYMTLYSRSLNDFLYPIPAGLTM